MYPSRRSAFTLVELSIVLVILGLLVGGVLTGQSLIRAAQLRSVTSDFNNYKTAMAAFRDKYFALPGDMTNAVRFWGAAAGATTDGVNSTCQSYTTPSTDGKTCNGDGDGKIAAIEIIRSWQQLANAGLIAGTYTGVGASPLPYQPGTNLPTSRVASNVGWYLMWFDDYPSYTYGSSYKNALLLSGFNASGVYPNAINPIDAWNIDVKLDDGLPQSGIVSPYYNYAGQTALSYPTCTVSSDLDYDKTKQQATCFLLMKTGF